MTIPGFIDAGGLRLPLSDEWAGPQLDLDGPLEAVAWPINHWIQGKFPELLANVERNQNASREGFYAVQASVDDLTEENTRVWQEMTGLPIGDDPILVGSPMLYESFVIPRPALLAILQEIVKLRAAAAMRERLPPVSDEQPGAAQLFTHTPTDQPPKDFERIALGPVEDLAGAVDEAQAHGRAEVSHMRRQLLEKLESHGLLDEVRACEKRAYLEGFRLPKLRDYMDAAKELRAYYRGPIREQYVCEPCPQRLLNGSVSLDWFRIPTRRPSGETQESWLALAERLVREAPRRGDAGKILANGGDRRYEILWRRDYDIPAVFATRDAQS